MIGIKNKKINDISLNNKKIDKAYLKNELVYSSKVKIATFSEGTDEEITAMLNAHYNGKINIEDYWHVGDERIIHLNYMKSTSTKYISHVAQDMVMTIIDFNHDNLEIKKGIRDKAAITIQCREILGNNGKQEAEYFWGKLVQTEVKDTQNSTTNPLRDWLNTVFIDAMPYTFNILIKTVIKKNLAKHTTSEGSPLKTEDKAFLLSHPEVFGTKKYLRYLNNSEVGEWEGTQYEYYKIDENRVKYANNNGIKGKDPIRWWLRSPTTYLDSYAGYGWETINADGNAGNGTYASICGLAPAFCL